MLEKIIKILFLIGIGTVGLLLIITDMVVAIAEFKWWALLVIPFGFIVFEIGFIAALIIADWIVYAIRNRTFKGFFEKVPSWKDELTETSPIEFCNACEKAYNPEESGGIVNGHPFCTKCLEGMGEDSARLEIENEKIKEQLQEFISAKEQKRLIILPPYPHEDEYAGLKVKYRVFKARNNESVEGCFVLRPDKDPAARAALRAYMESTDNQVLREDLEKWLEELEGGDSIAANNRCSQNSPD